MPELLKLRLRFCTGFENPFWFNIAFNSVATQLYLVLPDKFFCPPNLNLNIKMQTVSLPISVACYLYFTVPLVLKWVKKSLFHRQDSAEITGWDRRKSRIGLVLVRSRYSTEQKWKIESKLHVFFSILEESTAQNLFCQALMSQLHFGHGPLQRPFHCSVKRTPLTQGDWSASLY